MAPNYSSPPAAEEKVGAVVSPEVAEADYAQFAKRNLDKMSWLYPLVNNKLGDLLHLQLRHEHLFFMKDDRVLDEIGYGENGLRFHERDMGKRMETPAEISAQGYWFVAPRFHAEAAYDALQQVSDGTYYSVFSNQCQDWANRVIKRTLAIQKERNLQPPARDKQAEEEIKPVKITVPAAWYFGMIALIVGILGLTAPAMAGFHYLKFVSLLLFGIGISDLIYAFSSKSWSTFLSTVFFGLLALAGGGLMWANSYYLFAQSNGLLAVILAVAGVARLWVAASSRPFSAWIGTFLTGLLLLGTAGLAWGHRDGSAAGWLLGSGLSVSFISSGLSTIWLNWKLRKEA